MIILEISDASRHTEREPDKTEPVLKHFRKGPELPVGGKFTGLFNSFTL